MFYHANKIDTAGVVPRLTKYNACTTETSLMEYSPEQLNYFRLRYIAFKLVPDGLRKIFKQEWNFLYKTTRLGEWKDTRGNGNAFYFNESRRSRIKNARYLAKVKKGNAAEWDSTCLFFVILYSDSIGSTLSLAVKRDVDDLRQVQNDIAHIGEAKLPDQEFRIYVSKVMAAFNSLKLPITAINAVKNQTNFPTAEVIKLKFQVDKLRVGLTQAKSDFQVIQDTIQQNEAKEYNGKDLPFINKTTGDNKEHPKVAESYHSSAVHHRELGQHNEAKECDEKALKIRKKLYGKEHLEVAASYYNLAADYRELGQPNEAKECEKKALKIRKKLYGKEHPEVAASYYNLVYDYRELGQHNEAIVCHK